MALDTYILDFQISSSTRRRTAEFIQRPQTKPLTVKHVFQLPEAMVPQRVNAVSITSVIQIRSFIKAEGPVSRSTLGGMLSSGREGASHYGA